MTSGTATLARQRPAERRLGVACMANARAALGALTPSSEVVLLTAGQFGLSHLVAAVLAVTGPCACSIATWTAGRRAIGHIRRLRATGLLTDVRWWLDPSFGRRQPEYLAAVLDGFGPSAMRLAPVHAKAVTLTNDRWAVTIRGSLNLNHAVRAELIEISADRALTDWLTGLINDVFTAVPAGVESREAPAALARVFGVDASTVTVPALVFGKCLDDPGRPGLSRGL